jgi:hypothetical protein
MAEVISDKLIQHVKERFPNAKATFGMPPKPAIVFPAVHPEVGDIEIYDDGSEVRLDAGHFTHGHFSGYGSKSKEEAAQWIVEDVINFLERLFADQVILWGSHKSGGGWYRRDGESNLDPSKQGTQLYVWSGPLRSEGASPEIE